MLPQPLAPLGDYPQFVAWRIEHRLNEQTGQNVPTKVPYSPLTGYGASSSNPAHWGTLEQAEAYAASAGMAGIGFVFSERDPFFFLDIDGAWNGSAWSMVAQELCARLPGVAMEVSQSGTGLHLIGTGRPTDNHKNKNTPLHLELYTKERFVALTGTNATGSVSMVVDPAALAGVCEQFFKREFGATADEWTTTPDPEWSGPADDGELIARALRSGQQSAANAFGGRAGEPTFADLFTGNVDILRAKWPPNSPGGDFDHSSADQSLANLLAFWTGRNCDRSERIMRMSALARGKWDTHPTYLQNTILKAVGLVRNVYKQTVARDAAEPTPPPPAVTAAELQEAGFQPRAGAATIMLAQPQMAHFGGCVYVKSVNKILTPGGDLLDQSRFNAVYGGHEFVLSADGKKTTTSAWTAFTENQSYTAPIADRICFRPEHGEGGIVLDSGKRLANSYWCAEVDDLEGDASPFLDHLRRMLPYGNDYDLLLGWMAMAVQRPGEKLQWWPVVQGAEGNFKSFLLLIMSQAVGQHYAHLPNMDKMVKGNSNFNGWIDRKLFLGLEEVYAANRREFFESFKTTVTNLQIPIEGKGLEEVTGDNRANGIITTNFQDGVPIIGKSRRFAAFFCAQQTPEDMLRDGMDAAYVVRLKNWLLGRGAGLERNHGIRVMAHYLRTLQVEEAFNPLNMSRAPETSSTPAAVIAGRGRIEQEILEAIDEDRPGFSGGWVSSIYLDKLLEGRKLSLQYAKRRDVMISLGYDYHPALGPSGRVNNPIPPDNGKPRLYCKVDSIAYLNLGTAAAVVKAYSEAQTVASGEKSAAGMAFK